MPALHWSLDSCFKFFLFITPYSHGDFTAIVELPEGRHEYKFFVDGQWLHDPNEVCTFNTPHNYYECTIVLLVHENMACTCTCSLATGLVVWAVICLIYTRKVGFISVQKYSGSLKQVGVPPEAAFSAAETSCLQA